ncbi:uncharacterized protein LOC117650734 [Thrips palmi]|uniref:Uncharacterized protein LOC117650734 n=1 Tax=Thrips palmi TaxID=161013 RepID=A0A6P8ZYP4_THRPL|nr:uncharacterized protein LOC117650734 [Thrips palmi]
MKKRKAYSSKAAAEAKRSDSAQQQKQEEEQKKKPTSKLGPKALPGSDRGCDSEDENEGFGNWLRSTDGVAYMRLFVVANSLLVFMTMSWSHVWQVVDILRDAVGL